MKLSLLIILFFLNLTPRTTWAQELINVYTYHDHPPFVTSERVGLSRQLVDFLNDKTGNAYQFQLQIIPRQRLNALLKNWINGTCGSSNPCARNWLVPWVNPMWGFGKNAGELYQWIRMFRDANSIISLAGNAIDYRSPESLIGFRLGGMRGHHYVGIDQLVSKNKIRRIDGNQERDNVIKLIKGRVDAIVLPATTINYYLKQDPVISAVKADFYVAEHNHQEYERYIMIPGQAKELITFMNDINFRSPGWLEILSQSGINPEDLAK